MLEPITVFLPLAMASATAAPAPASPLHYRFEVGRAAGTIYNPWTLKDDPVQLRSFRGQGIRDGDFMAPTIRVAPGQRLEIDLLNRLEPCTAEQRASRNCFNDTNLHTHGLWVSPAGHSDNVLVSVAPGEEFQYRYDVPVDHPAGTFWYHPHRHGNGFIQVGSGMAGALIVTGDRLPTATSPGDIDILLKDARGKPFAERVMLFQQIQYGCLNDKGLNEGERDKDNEPIRPFTCSPGKVGGVESIDNDWGWRRTGRFTGINGKVQPQLGDAKAGDFERWRLINAGTGEAMRMRLYRLDPDAPPLRTIKADAQIAWRERYCIGQPLPMWQIALDGLTRSAIRKTDEAILMAGERNDVLVRLPEQGLYCVVNDTSRIDKDKLNPSRMVALVGAKGRAPRDADADARLQSLLIRSAMNALPGSERSAIQARVVGDLRDGLKLSAFTWHKPIPQSEVRGYREAILNVYGEPEEKAFRMNGRSYDHDRIDAVLPLGKAEEWLGVSLAENHPLHIHVNPFQVISVNNAQGEDITDPKGPAYDPDYAGLKGEWKDTVFIKKNLEVVFRTRYQRFTGDFVLHCHIMFHHDHGMMQNLRIAEDGQDIGAPHTAH